MTVSLPTLSRIQRFAFNLLVVASAIASATAQVSAAGHLYRIGDFQFGLRLAEVRSAVRNGPEILAAGRLVRLIGNSTSNTPVLWSSKTGIIPLSPPLLVDPLQIPTAATALSENGVYVTSSIPTADPTKQFESVRFEVSSLTPFPLGGDLSESGWNPILAISGDGAVVYGTVQDSQQAFRFDYDRNESIRIPFLHPGDTNNSPSPRGCSTNGQVLVGNSLGKAGSSAYRYVHGSGVTAIPLLPGASNNSALCLSADGKSTLLTASTPVAPLGELYVHHADSGSIERLGTPRGDLSVAIGGGINGDGSVVIANFEDPSTNEIHSPFLHNRHGWYSISQVIGDLQPSPPNFGHPILSVEGVSPDGTLMWGNDSYWGVTNGWVLDLPLAYLENYHLEFENSAQPPDLIGAWTLSNPTGPDREVLFFLPSGEYIHAGTREETTTAPRRIGFERGHYIATNTRNLYFFPRRDYNAELGIGRMENSFMNSIFLNGNRLEITSTVRTPMILTRVIGTSPLIGGWIQKTDSTAEDSFSAIAFLADKTYVHVREGEPDGTGQSGIERGTYAWDEATGAFTANALIDDNGGWGLSPGRTNLVVQGDSMEGFRRITGSPRFDYHSLNRKPDGTFSARIECKPGALLTVESSTDLIHWTEVKRFGSFSDWVNFTHDAGTNSNALFYRVQSSK